MTTVPPRRNRPSARSRFFGIDWVTVLTASPTWMVISRAFRAGPYPFSVPVGDPAKRRAGRSNDASSTERGIAAEPSSRSLILERNTMEPAVIADLPDTANDAAPAASGGTP